MIIVRSMWDGRQKKLAELLEVDANSLEQFFSKLRKKIKKNELELEDLQPHISPEYHSKLEQFFSLTSLKPNP
jgi:hypothetical protein